MNIYSTLRQGSQSSLDTYTSNLGLFNHITYSEFVSLIQGLYHISEYKQNVVKYNFCYRSLSIFYDKFCTCDIDKVFILP